MSNTPSISIVMPAYNAANYIRESIDSILIQSYRDFELIIVDDGSTDNTISIIKAYNDNRINLICNDHNFIGSLNLGVTKSVGKYIVRMDSDDIMLPDRLFIQNEFMEANPDIDISGTWIEAFGKRQEIMKNALTHNLLQLQAIIYTPLYHPTVIFRRDILKSYEKIDDIWHIYNKDYIYAEDYKLWIDLITKGYKFANIPRVLLKYRCTDTQVTSVRQEDTAFCTYKIQSEYLEYIIEYIINKNDHFYDFLCEVINLYNSDEIHFNELRNIIYNIYSEVLILD